MTGWSQDAVAQVKITWQSLLGCLDGQSLEVSSILNGCAIVGVDFQSPERPIDLVFRLEGGKDLEIFSTDLNEPWVLTLPKFGIFVGIGEIIL